MDLPGICEINTSLVLTDNLQLSDLDFFMHISNAYVVLNVQAMVHELIGIQDNKVDLKSSGRFPKDQEVGYISYIG